MANRDNGAGRVVPVRLDAALLAAIDAHAEREGTNRSQVIRAALTAFLSEREPPAGRLFLTRDQAQLVRDIADRFGIERLDLFGSFARGEATPASDIDLLYTLRPGVRLGWALEDLTEELTAALGRPVDLVSRSSLHQRMRARVLAEAEVLYAA